MDDKQSPALPEILEERDRIITRVGNSEIVMTKDSITIQERYKSRPGSSSEDNSKRS